MKKSKKTSTKNKSVKKELRNNLEQLIADALHHLILQQGLNSKKAGKAIEKASINIAKKVLLNNDLQVKTTQQVGFQNPAADNRAELPIAQDAPATKDPEIKKTRTSAKRVRKTVSEPEE